MKPSNQQLTSLTKNHLSIYQKKLKTISKSKSHFKSLKTLQAQLAILKKYDPLHWFCLSQAEKLLHLSTLKTYGLRDEFTEIDNLIFEGWNQSEFAFNFLSFLNKGKSLAFAHKACLKIFDQHLTTLFERHLLLKNSTHPHYRPQVAFGEKQTRKGIQTLLSCYFMVDKKKIKLFGNTLSNLKSHSLRIEHALRIIKRHSPDAWSRFCSFTDVIVPIDQEEFVSFSEQVLPGYSMLNLFNRDFVDLMDDLIHENGHHHLNFYLNQKKLIQEPLDEIYYSPWRRTLRPLRGIYHAYFTFFWAFELFKDLSITPELDSIWYLFNASEKEKIYWRAVEEFHMLNYTFEDLKWAKSRKLISSEGWKLVELQQRELMKAKPFILKLEKRLRAYRKDLTQLKKTLKQARKEYSLV